jgi:hypothetical protein
VCDHEVTGEVLILTNGIIFRDSSSLLPWCFNAKVLAAFCHNLPCPSVHLTARTCVPEVIVAAEDRIYFTSCKTNNSFFLEF